MKLINYANRNLFIFLFLLIGVWGVFFYLTIIDEVIDETDDRLKNSREIIVGKALINPDILLLQDTIMQTYKFRELTNEEAKVYKENFYDSSIYIASEDEWEPVRVMKSCFRASDGKFYEIEINISTLERDDLIRAILIYLLILYVSFLVMGVIGNYFVLKRTFAPLKRLLDWLTVVTPGKITPHLNNETEIIEFRKLNEVAWEMSKRGESVYQEQKQFIENVSHELQTPLGIASNKLELLADSDNLTEKQINELDNIYQTICRAVRLNKSLLLLSRINNGQYTAVSEVNIGELINKIVDELKEVYEDKNIFCSVEEYNICKVHMNDVLAYTLLSNLIKNAIVHTFGKGGEVKIKVYSNKVFIYNDGEVPLDNSRVFQRFYRVDNATSEDSTGLGLSIIKSIMDFYGFTICYDYEKGHTFTLNFVKN